MNSPENLTPAQESEIKWTSTCERFAQKIDAEIEQLGDAHPRVIKLNDLKSQMTDMFAGYEHGNKTIREVEDDIEYRIKNAENESDIEIYKQIQLFISGTFKIVI